MEKCELSVWQKFRFLSFGGSDGTTGGGDSPRKSRAANIKRIEATTKNSVFVNAARKLMRRCLAVIVGPCKTHPGAYAARLFLLRNLAIAAL